MTVAQRRAADEAMAARDKRAKQSRRQRDRAPAFMQSDDEDERQEGDDPLQGINQRRRRRQYDEVRQEDDMDGVEDVRVPLRLSSLPPSPLTPLCLARSPPLHRRSLSKTSATSKRPQSTSGSRSRPSSGRSRGTSSSSS